MTELAGKQKKNSKLTRCQHHSNEIWLMETHILEVGPLLIPSRSCSLAHATLGRREFKFATRKYVGGTQRKQTDSLAHLEQRDIWKQRSLSDVLKTQTRDLERLLPKLGMTKAQKSHTPLLSYYALPTADRVHSNTKVPWQLVISTPICEFLPYPL